MLVPVVAVFLNLGYTKREKNINFVESYAQGGSIVRAVFFIFYFPFQVDCSILVIGSNFFPSSPDPIDHIGYCHHFVGIRTAWPIETNFDGNVPWA
jgi:hypothetical protein